jgi:membrane-anchored protein YejM (alkaline phosphatase superfamily)
VSPDLTNIPFILIHPDEQGFKVNRSTASQVDVLPTLLDYMNIESTCKRYSQGQSLISNDYTDRPIYISSINAYGIVENGYYFEFPDRNIPECNIYKISESIDNKAVYTKIEDWAVDDIKEKHARVARFYELQRMFLDKL